MHQSLLEALGPKLYDVTMTQTELEAQVRATLQEVLSNQETPLTVADRSRIAQDVALFTLGFVGGASVCAGWATVRPGIEVDRVEAAFI